MGNQLPSIAHLLACYSVMAPADSVLFRRVMVPNLTLVFHLSVPMTWVHGEERNADVCPALVPGLRSDCPRRPQICGHRDWLRRGVESQCDSLVKSGSEVERKAGLVVQVQQEQRRADAQTSMLDWTGRHPKSSYSHTNESLE